MRTPPRFKVALAAVAGVGLFGALPAHADTNVALSSCSNWSITSGVFNCTAATVTSGAPAGCTLSVDRNALASTGGTVTLSANCTNPPATSWSWSGGFMTGQTAATGTGSVTATTTFTATPSNGAGPGAAQSVTVTVASSATGGGNVAGGISCPGFANTRVINMPWANVQLNTAKVGGFGSKDAVVVAFTPTTARAGTGRLWAGTSSSAANKTAVLSASPCDFDGKMAMFAKTQGISTNNYYFIGTSGLFYPVLQAGTTYYLNIKNEDCPDGTICDVGVELTLP